MASAPIQPPTARWEELAPAQQVLALDEEELIPTLIEAWSKDATGYAKEISSWSKQELESVCERLKLMVRGNKKQMAADICKHIKRAVEDHDEDDEDASASEEEEIPSHRVHTTADVKKHRPTLTAASNRSSASVRRSPSAERSSTSQRASRHRSGSRSVSPPRAPRRTVNRDAIDALRSLPPVVPGPSPSPRRVGRQSKSTSHFRSPSGTPFEMSEVSSSGELDTDSDSEEQEEPDAMEEEMVLPRTKRNVNTRKEHVSPASVQANPTRIQSSAPSRSALRSAGGRVSSHPHRDADVDSFASEFIENALGRSGYDSVFRVYKVEVEFRTERNKKECLVLAEVVDALRRGDIHSALDLTTRRLAGVHLADSTNGNWNMCDALESRGSTQSFVPHATMARVLKRVAQVQAIHAAGNHGTGAASGGGGSSSRRSRTSEYEPDRFPRPTSKKDRESGADSSRVDSSSSSSRKRRSPSARREGAGSKKK